MTSLGEHIFRLLLVAYPQEFRQRYREDLLAFFREDRRHPRYGTGPLRTLRFWNATVRDLVRAAWHQHRTSHAGTSASRRRRW